MSKQEIEITGVTERTVGVDVVWDTVVNDGLIAYYPLNGDALDETGNYDGTNNGATFVDDGERGYVGNFDGVDDYIAMSSIKIEDNVYAVSAFVSPVPSEQCSILGGDVNGLDGGSYFCLRVRENKVYWYIRKGEETLYNDSGTINIPDNVFTHVVVILADDKIRGYVDSVLDVEVDFSRSAINTKNTYIGLEVNANGNAYYRQGLISNLRIYNRELSSGEITDIYDYEKDMVLTDGEVPHVDSSTTVQDLEFTEDIVASSVAFENTATTLVEASDTYDGTKFTKSYSKVTKGGRELAWSASADKDLEIQKVSVALNKEPS